MSAHVVIIAADLRRATVKVSPGTYLVDVLEQGCTKLRLSSDKYTLKHKQKQVDLSVPYRTSGLLPGAKLELVQRAKTPSAVQVALQLPGDQGRLVRKFPADLTLWKMLRQFEADDVENVLNLTACAGGKGGRRLPFLRADVAERGEAVHVPEPPVPEESAADEAVPVARPAEREEKKDGGGKKMPKWLKLGKK
ncbi:UBX domain-containing protein [Ophiocordyceps camponoti-floridani]|uniref:UBX domain-containing protein n=1 Tax=Ophiocordyceps camponoti-floridani TaxID=2030778 RepID=A0A8H4VDI3_9HYPO|nr:UBX domain-containing protein [Ophiocordyceps camponoti-floridani]